MFSNPHKFEGSCCFHPNQELANKTFPDVVETPLITVPDLTVKNDEGHKLLLDQRHLAFEVDEGGRFSYVTAKQPLGVAHEVRPEKVWVTGKLSAKSRYDASNLYPL